MSLAKFFTTLIGFANKRTDVFRYIAIDPGSDTLGVAFMEINLRTQQLTITEVTTLVASKQLVHYPVMVEIHGEKAARLHAHGKILDQILDLYQPHGVVSESPFMGRFPAAFAALTECMAVIRNAVFRFRPFLPLETVDPPSAKKAVGVKAKGSSKEDIEVAVKKLTDIVWADGLSPEGHTEHEYDAIAVGYWKYLTLIGKF